MLVAELVQLAVDRKRSVDRSREAFNELVKRFQDAAFAYAYGLLGSPASAEDATQAAFLTAWLRMASLREAAGFGAWLRRIVHTECHRILRRPAIATVPLESAPEPRINSTPIDAVAARETREAVRQAIASLPENDRLAICLHYIGEYSYKEIAAFLDVPLSTVRKRLHSARQRLRAVCK